ncbi:MAG: hypothetical protein QXF45_07835 [Candidatus Caldarchaeum sp.]|uniref:Uncharacterized protein n=1 Tax=Caldiarchaeum subterraneum TaxID=311458 RepID=A0A7C5Y500_CALS0
MKSFLFDEKLIYIKSWVKAMTAETIRKGSQFEEGEWNALMDVARTLRFFVIESRYGHVDRLANAFNKFIAQTALQEALREARSAADAGEKVHIPSEDVVKKVVDLFYRDLSSARILAALALAYPEKVGGEK